mmetsp:Transcript_5659/g.16390  ORF Transcript_5659/g.16390 Transcript_5659/m.16390 type:complete len:218 (-) Transcript_5659:10-663(-)
MVLVQLCDNRRALVECRRGIQLLVERPLAMLVQKSEQVLLILVVLFQGHVVGQLHHLARLAVQIFPQRVHDLRAVGLGLALQLAHRCHCLRQHVLQRGPDLAVLLSQLLTQRTVGELATIVLLFARRGGELRAQVLHDLKAHSQLLELLAFREVLGGGRGLGAVGSRRRRLRDGRGVDDLRRGQEAAARTRGERRNHDDGCAHHCYGQGRSKRTVSE